MKVLYHLEIFCVSKRILKSMPKNTAIAVEQIQKRRALQVFVERQAADLWTRINFF